MFYQVLKILSYLFILENVNVNENRHKGQGRVINNKYMYLHAVSKIY